MSVAIFEKHCLGRRELHEGYDKPVEIISFGGFKRIINYWQSYHGNY